MGYILFGCLFFKGDCWWKCLWKWFKANTGCQSSSSTCSRSSMWADLDNGTFYLSYFQQLALWREVHAKCLHLSCWLCFHCSVIDTVNYRRLTSRTWKNQDINSKLQITVLSQWESFLIFPFYIHTLMFYVTKPF